MRVLSSTSLVDVTKEEATAEAEAFWQNFLEAKEKLLPGVEPKPESMEILKQFMVLGFVSGAGWMRTELNNRAAALVKELVEVAVLSGAEQEGDPS